MLSYGLLLKVSEVDTMFLIREVNKARDHFKVNSEKKFVIPEHA